MKKQLFGKLPTGEMIHLYELKSGTARACVINYGAALQSFQPFGDTDIVGGFDTLEGYLQDTSNQGVIVGRVANRIADARFDMDGQTYFLPDNDNGNCLHGGTGFQKKVWKEEQYCENSVTLSYASPDQEDGFPADLTVKVTYQLEGTALIIRYEGIPAGKTPIALTNHAYFNLEGFGNDIKNHFVLAADTERGCNTPLFGLERSRAACFSPHKRRYLVLPDHFRSRLQFSVPYILHAGVPTALSLYSPGHRTAHHLETAIRQRKKSDIKQKAAELYALPLLN